jgi:MFS family permease
VYVASSRTGRGESRVPATGRGVPGTVVALGAVSMFTDISAEMVTAFLPVYLLFTLHLSYVQFGLLDGIYTGATAVLRLAGGYVADRLGRPKAVALSGYGLSAMTKLAFPLVGSSVAGIGAVLSVDRAGKGLRTAPRDALLSLATPPDRLGVAFGVHRTMDTAGAMLGPLVTFALLAYLGTRGEPVFVISFLFALIGVIVLVFFVPDRPAGQASDRTPAQRHAVSPRRVLHLLHDRPLRRTAAAAALLGLATLSDAFLFVVLQRASGVDTSVLPLLPLGTAAVFLLAATPVGRLSDRVGRWRVFLAGHVLLLGAYLLLLAPFTGYPLVVAVLALHGLFYAATDGVLMAHGGTLVPAHLRASGLAVVQTGQALARLASSTLFGVMLQYLAFGAALWTAILALAGGLIAVTVVIRPMAGSPP